MAWLRRLGLAALTVFVVASAPAWGHDKPDLIADPPERPMLEPDSSDRAEERLLLRFDGHVHNTGVGPLEVRRQAGLVEQLLRTASDLGAAPLGHPLATTSMLFEDTDGHNHWHLQRIARYSLYDPSGTAPVAPVMKVGFCLVDSTRISGSVPGRYGSNCGRDRPNATTVTMGVSSGWRDLYDRDLPFQWVDVSETQPGTYRLRSEIDPFDLIDEENENDVPGERNVVVPGFRAAIGDAPISGTAAVALSLMGAEHSSPLGAPLGVRRFRLTSAPAHGALNVSTGSWFTDPGVTYKPAAPGDQPDRFTYVADDDGSDFPRFPGRATVLLGDTGNERVAMSGVPETLRAGMTVDLDAEVFDGASSVVTWTAPGASIDAGGRLTAPPTVPPGGKVAVTAHGTGGAVDTMDVTIAPPPKPSEPAPRPDVDDGDEPGPTAGELPAVAPSAPAVAPAPPSVPRTTPSPARKRVPIGSVRIRRIGPQYAIAIRSRSTGRVRASLLKGRRKLASCTVRVSTRRSALCRLRVHRGATAIALTLVRRDGKVEHRRVKVPGRT